MGNKKITQEAYLQKLQVTYGDMFNLDKVIYTGAHDKITITCRIHGDFMYRASDFSRTKRPCPRCLMLEVSQYRIDKKINLIKKLGEFKDYGEFVKSRTRYMEYVRYGLLDEAKKLLPPSPDLSRRDRIVYAYEFPDKHVYVGLTCSLTRRSWQHMFHDNYSSVKEHIETTKLLPVLVVKTSRLPSIDASRKEGEIVDIYLSEGWKILNKAKTGGLGATKPIYTKESCIMVISRYTFLKDFRKNNPNMFAAIQRNNWYDLYQGLTKVIGKQASRRVRNIVTGKEYISTIEAGRDTGINPSTIRASIARGRNKTKTWEYVQDGVCLFQGKKYLGIDEKPGELY